LQNERQKEIRDIAESRGKQEYVEGGSTDDDQANGATKRDPGEIGREPMRGAEGVANSAIWSLQHKVAWRLTSN